MQEKIDARTDSISKDIQAKRFDAEDVKIALTEGESLLEIVSKVIASIRTNALLRMDREVINPNKWTAHNRFNRAKWALNRWDFQHCDDNLEEAIFLTREPELQQRITLFRWILDLIASLYKTKVESKRDFTALINSISGRLEKFDQLDKLTPEEREFYAKELRKLQEVISALKSDDPFSVTLFDLWHAKKDLELSSNEVSLVWTVKAFKLQKEKFNEKLDASDPVFKALEQVHDSCKYIIELDGGAEAPEAVNPYDFLSMFKDRLGELFAKDIDKEIFYAFNVLHYNEPLKEEESKSQKKNRKGKEKHGGD